MSFIRPVLRRQYDLYVERAGNEGFVGIHNCFGFGALLAQETHPFPLVTVHCQPAVLWSAHAPPSVPGVFGPRWLRNLMYSMGERFVIDPEICPFLNAWRGELGLPPVRRVTRLWNSPFAVVGLFPEWFAPRQPDWPAQLIQTDFPLWNHRSEEAVAPEVEAFLSAGDPPIVFTPGSANVHGESFMTAAVESCRLLGRRGILLTGYEEQLPRSLPDTIAAFDYVPLDRLLPRAAAFVHHGGIGSTSQGLYAGVPQLLMPLAHDQFDNAARLKNLGIAASVPSNRFTGKRVASALGPLLASEQVREACGEYARRLAPRAGLRCAADAIEQRVARAVPGSR